MRDLVEVVPSWIRVVLGGLVSLSALFAGSYLFSSLRARRLARQRGELLRDVGVLQEALLPAVPERLGAVRATVAYRPADGPAAGGDFYDLVALADGRTAVVVGDVSGHGREALAHTAFLRYTLRAHLQAGLELRRALQTAAAAADDHLRDQFATVLLAVFDPRAGSLTYAGAGHPPPLIVGSAGCEPVTVGASPPLGMGLPTGMRQTTLPLRAGAVVSLFTDGVTDARTAGGRLEREGLAAMVSTLGKDITASALLDRVAGEACELRDDMAVCVLVPTAKVADRAVRREILEVSCEDLDTSVCHDFLCACGLPVGLARAVEDDAGSVAERYGRAVVRATLGSRVHAEALAPDAHYGEAASSRPVPAPARARSSA